MSGHHQYTEEQILFLKNNVNGRSRKDLTTMFNARFGLDLSVLQLAATYRRRKLTTGRDGRFTPGQVPWSKEQKMPGAGKATWFPKGSKPWNYQAVGAERVNGDGYVDIKIADPKKWRAKHLRIWEKANGPLPAGHVVIFADGNKRNFDLNNLLLLSRRELAVMNKFGLIQSETDLTKTMPSIARIKMKCSERKKGLRRNEQPG